MKCIKVKSREYSVIVKKECAKKVLQTTKITCGDCYCKYVDCDKCSLRDGHLSIYNEGFVTFEDTTDKRFDVTDLINEYYKPMKEFNLKVGDIVKADDKIISITQHKTKFGDFIEVSWDNGKYHYATHSIDTVKWNLIREYYNLEIIREN